MSALATVPGYIAGTWAIDPVNSEVGFTVRCLGVSRVHGRFNEVAGTIVTAETAGLSSVSATVGARSIDTSFPGRDTVAGFSAAATIRRTDFGFSEKVPPAIIGDKVDIYLDIQAVLAA